MAKVKSVRALERGLQVLERVREAESVSLNDLHRQTKLSRATLLRALKTLEQGGWIQPGHEGATYRLGPKMFGSTTFSSRHRTLADLAIPVLNALGKKVIWPSDVGICRGTSMVILESSRRNSPFVINRNAVGRRPSLLKSAMGRAYLTFCPQEERERLLDRLRRSTHPDDKLAAMTSSVHRILHDTCARGYGVREPGYWAGADDYGGDVSSIAVPVMVGEQVAACISLLWVTGTSSIEDFARAHLGALREAADRLAHSLED
jgi:IclR family mhp operon transcriptional activator